MNQLLVLQQQHKMVRSSFNIWSYDSGSANVGFTILYCRPNYSAPKVGSKQPKSFKSVLPFSRSTSITRFYGCRVPPWIFSFKSQKIECCVLFYLWSIRHPQLNWTKLQPDDHLFVIANPENQLKFLTFTVSSKICLKFLSVKLLMKSPNYRLKLK